MKLAERTLNARWIAVFFFFSWIIQLLWNSILVDQLALVAFKLNYWQAAALWFLTTLLFAWVGIGVQPTRRTRIRERGDWDEIGHRIERKVRGCVSRWVEDDKDPDDLGERIEANIKRGFSRWVGVDEEIDWDDLGEHIERKIKQKVRDWAEEE
jgi:hypothetical protein